MSTSSKTFNFGRLEACAEIGWLGGCAPYSVLVRLGQGCALASCEVIEDAQDPERQRLHTSFCKRSYALGAMANLGRREDQPSATDLAYADFLQSIFEPVLRSAPSTCLKLHVQLLEEDPRIDNRLAASLAASLCLSLTGQVQGSPKALVQLAVIDGRCQVNPDLATLPSAQADLWVFGDTEHLLHVDGSARELDEALLVKALEAAHGSIKEASQVLAELSGLGKPELDEPVPSPSCPVSLRQRVRAHAARPLFEIFSIPQAEERNARWRDLHKAVQLALCLNDDHPDYLSKITLCFRQLSIEVLRSRILGGHLRPDQRTTEQLRIRSKIEVGRHSRAHGSASAAMIGSMVHAAATLGINRTLLSQLPGAAADPFSAHIYLHAHHPAAVATPKAASSWLTHALRPVMPSVERFPYAIRLDCEHWGEPSTSRQDTLYTATLALMDAGVPIKTPVAAVEVGLIRSPSHFITLSDPDDTERLSCDLTATLAGTQAGLTAIYIRSQGVRLTPDILAVVLQQARQNRLELLLRMSHALAAPRTLNPQVPRVKILRIAPNQTGLLVGRGGTTVRALCEDTRSQIEVFPDGRVLVSASNDLCMQSAIAAIETALQPIRIGQIYQGTVSGVSEQGVLITLAPGRTGLLPISAIANSHAHPEKQFQVGESVRTFCADLDKRGRIWLSLKALSEQEEIND